MKFHTFSIFLTCRSEPKLQDTQYMGPAWPLKGHQKVESGLACSPLEALPLQGPCALGRPWHRANSYLLN